MHTQNISASYKNQEAHYFLSARALDLSLSFSSLILGKIKPAKIALEDVTYKTLDLPLQAEKKLQPNTSAQLTDLANDLIKVLEDLPILQLEINNAHHTTHPFWATFIHTKNSTKISVTQRKNKAFFKTLRNKTGWDLTGNATFFPAEVLEIFPGNAHLLSYMNLHALHPKISSEFQLSYTVQPDKKLLTHPVLKGHYHISALNRRKKQTLKILGILDGNTLKTTQAIFIQDHTKMTLQGILEAEKTGKWALKIHTPKLLLKEFLSLWPAGIGTSATSWMKEHIHEAQLSANATLQGNLFSSDPTPQLQGRFAFQNLTLSPLQGLPLITLNGRATFDTNKIAFSVSDGKMAQQKILPSKVLIYGLDQDDEKIDLTIATQGPLENICQILSVKPFDYIGRLSVPLASLKGVVASNLKFSFPLWNSLKMKDVTFNVQADAKDMVYGYSLGDQLLDFNKGAAHFSLDNALLSLQGRCFFRNRPLKFWLNEPLGISEDKTTLGAQIDLDHQLLTDFGAPSIKEWLPETFQCTVSYKPGTSFPISLQCDFKETPLILDPLWIKLKGTPASAQVVINPHTHTLDLVQFESEGFKALGKAQLKDSYLPESISLSLTQKGKNDAKLSFWEEKDTAHIKLAGKKLTWINLDKILLGLGSENQKKTENSFEWPYKEITINSALDTLCIAPDLPLKRFSLFLKGHQNLSSFRIDRFSSRAHAPRKSPKEKKQFFVIKSQDDMWRLESNRAGYFLKALNLTPVIQEGACTIDIGPKQDSGARSGKLLLQNFGMQRTSFMQRFFMTLLSPTSFAQMFSGSSVPFSKLKIIFHLDDGIVDLETLEAHSLDSFYTAAGWIDSKADALNIRGNLVPLAFLNQILRNIPLLGPALAGGKEDGLFATRFYLKGQLSDPSVNTNPMQILVPGLIKTPVDRVEAKQISNSRRKTNFSQKVHYGKPTTVTSLPARTQKKSSAKQSHKNFEKNVIPAVNKPTYQTRRLHPADLNASPEGLNASPDQ